MRKGFSARVLMVIDQSDALLEILDARFAEETRNHYIEKKILEKNKKLIFVLNKADLVENNRLIKKKKELMQEARTVFLSAKNRKGIHLLKKEINIALGEKDGKVGVIGYPNTGKSSIINALKRRKVARTSIKAGFTRGEMLVKVSDKIRLIDTPGIIPFEERDEFKLVLTLSKNENQISEADFVGFKLIEFFLKENPNEIERFYGVKGTDAKKIFEEIALKKKYLLKGNEPDLNRTGMQIIRDYQTGKIRI